ncbi:hypothetical protein FB45DRAFT_1112660 [Roridomyces roridus]|uniref:DUF6533 domain-containing protein n=1 Tax=Roridomyces roridus TaxID=1738132 RepID=A0AAD7B7L1_9AGAR|nr:hypothetical protein FB45DRAFT_1112660 [Roridomyces roridus]
MPPAQLDVGTLAHDQCVRRRLFLAGLVVLCYNHLLTLDEEITYIWTPKLKRSSIWFLLVRYFALAGNFALIPYFLGDLDVQTCQKLSTVQNCLLLIQETFVETTLATRVLAMYGFNRRVFAALGVVAVITIGLGVFSVTGPNTSISTTLSGCHMPTSHGMAIRMAAAWEAQLVCDILIVCLTMHRACSYQAHGGIRMHSILGIMVRDGALYFGMIGLVVAVNIMGLYLISAGSLAWFASTISVTMVCRLMLNLHGAAHRDWEESDSAMQLGTTSATADGQPEDAP